MKPYGSATYLTLNRMACDWGNDSMRKAGRSTWSETDAAAAQARFEQLLSLFALPDEAMSDTCARLHEAARGTFYEGTCPL